MAFRVGKYGVGWSPLTHRAFAIDLTRGRPPSGEQGKVKSIFDTLDEEHPDDLVRKKGLVVYQEMMKHPTIKAGSQLLAVGIVAPGYDINPAVTGEGEYEKHAAYVKEQLEKLPGSFRTTQIAMLSSRIYGASFTEMVWADEPIDTGEFQGKWGLAGIKTKPPFKYSVKRDDFGNLVAITHDVDFGEKDEYDPFKWVIVSHDAGSVFGHPLGLSQLRPCHIYWKAHKLMFPKWGTFVEKTAAGVPIISYDDMSHPDQVKKYEQLARNIASGSSVAKSKNVILEWAEKMGSSHLEFSRFLEYCERSMLRPMLVPDQLGIGPESKVGSLAKAKVHATLFDWVMDDMDADLTAGFNDKAIPYMVGTNWVTDRYPILKRKSRDPEEAAQLVAQFIAAADSGMVGPTTLDDVNRIRSEAGFAELDEKAWQEYLDAEADKKADYEPIQGPVDDEDDDPDKGKSGKKFAAPARRITIARITSGLHTNSTYLRELTDVEKKAGLRPKRLEHDLDRIMTVGSDLMAQSMTTAQAQLLKRLGRAGLLDGSAPEAELWDFGRENGLGGNAKQMFRDAWLTATTSAYLLGAFDARSELKKSTGGRIEFTEDDGTFDFASHGTVIVKPKEAAAFWAQLTPMDKAKARALKRQSFYITGLYLEPHGELLRRIKQVIQTGYDTGSWGAVESKINRLFDEWLGSGRLMPEAGGGSHLFTRWHTETIVRNATMRAYNQGKLVQFANSGAWVERLQWSSIMGPRTTDYCDSMDTVVFNRGEIDVPPAHHDCRSTIFAVTSGTTYRETDRDVLIRRQTMRDPDFMSGVLAL